MCPSKPHVPQQASCATASLMWVLDADPDYGVRVRVRTRISTRVRVGVRITIRVRIRVRISVRVMVRRLC